MFRRLTSMCQKWFLILLIYFFFVHVISYMINYKGSVLFIPQEKQLGNKYVFVYLKSGASPALTDAETAHVFNMRDCDYCVVTNNKRFIPLNEYNAVLIHSDRYAVEDTSAAVDKEKMYLLEATHECVTNKFVNCEPRITSFATNLSYKLCELCQHLHNNL